MAEKAGEINRAQADVHKNPGAPRRGAASSSARKAVGNETKADMRGAQEGQPNEKAVIASGGLKGAVEHLHSEHPIEYHEHGPHHGTTHHIRHEPLHGLKPR